MIPTVSIDTLFPTLAPALAAVAAAALKGVLPVALAALAATTVLRHRAAAARHAIWTAALAAHLLLIAAAPFLPAVSVPGFRLPAWLSASGSEYTVATPTAGHSVGPVAPGPHGVGPSGGAPTRFAPVGVEAIGPSPEAGAGVTPSASASASTSLRPASAQPHKLISSQADKLRTHLPTLWLLGVLLVFGRLLLGAARVQTLARAAERITDPPTLGLAQRTANRLGIVRPITLLRGDRLSIPITWGVVYPTVLLPSSSDDWPDDRRRVVLVHEMAHVKRFDAFTQLVAQLALALFWFDPLVWLAARRMRAEREHACDDYVLRDGTRPSLYANELLDMVRRLAGRAGEAGAPAFAALAMARRSEFEGRMLAILDPAADRQGLSRAVVVACATGMIALLVPLAALRPFEARSLEAAPASGSVRAPTTTILTIPAARARASTAARSSALAAASIQAPGSAGGAAQDKLPIMYRCTPADVRSTNNTRSIHTDNAKPGRDFLEYYVKKYGRCLHAVFAGRVIFTADERDIASLGPDARVQLHERTLDWERSLVVTRGDDGSVRRVYTTNGRLAAYDASAQSWVAGLIHDLARESGVEVPRRVSRIRARGGVTAVLAEISEIESDGAKRKHYEALLGSGELTSADVDRVVRHARRELAGSSGDLRAVLRHVPRGGVRSIDAALEEAIGRMSDGDKQQVLASMLDGADGPTLAVVMRLAERIGSDGDKSGLLRRAAPRVLDGSTSTLREAFFRAYATLGSDGDKQAVLLAALRQGQRSSALTREVIRGAGRIGSDGDKTAVLLSVARNGLLTTDELRGEYVKTARTIGSDGDYRAVIDAVLGGKPGA